MDGTGENCVVCSCGTPAILLTVKNPASSNLGEHCMCCEMPNLLLPQDGSFTSVPRGKVVVISFYGRIHQPAVVVLIMLQCHHHLFMVEIVHKAIAG